MEFDPALILFIIFILAPLIERLLKGNKQPPPPPPPSRPQQRMPQQRPRPEVERPEPTTSQQQGREPSAAEMVPDDLWAILTGEQRPRTPAEPPQQERPLPPAQEPRRQPPSRPTPAPAPTSQRPAPVARRPLPPEATPPVPQRRPPPVVQRPTPAGYDMRGELPPDEEATFRRPPPPERYPVEGYVREVPTHAPPEIVSLEELVIDDVKRHESFHDRLAALPKAERVHHDKSHELAQRFLASGELRRAIIMSEVLGPPRSMD